jgi:hypothetical protein
MNAKNMESEKEQEKVKRKNNYEKILEKEVRNGYLVPVKWKYPYSFRKKDYLAIVIGLNQRYEFERVFCEKIEFEVDEKDKRELSFGYLPHQFQDGMILEEKFSYKENNTFVTNTNYYEIYLFEGGEVWGQKISKTEIKNRLHEKQQRIYDEIRELMSRYGSKFTLYTMRSILRQKKQLKDQINFFFMDS